MNELLFEIVNRPISIETVINKVIRRDSGAITTFIGTVRKFTNGKKTLYLAYEAYETMAIKMFAQINDEINAKWSDVKVAITHRVGRLEINDIAIVIAVLSPHRKAAYEANKYAIERIKQIAPIWKKRYGKIGLCG